MKFIFLIKRFLSRLLPPQRLFIFSFASMILFGAILLWLSFSSSRGHITFVDALFTSASAVCVTGLTVLDIGKDLSLEGQIITLFLIQIGGLGITTFSVVLFGLMGRGISFKGRDIVQSTFIQTPRRDFFMIMKWVIMLTFVIEAIGTFFLFIRFSQDYSLGWAFYQSVYHAVSAFNNCGHSLFTNNLMDFQNDITINLIIMGLIVLGGIGFIVQYEVISCWRGFQKKLSVHSNIVLITTACLILGGAVFFYMFEVNHILKDASVKTQILTSFFQSVTPRTAGFSTVNVCQLTNPTILVLIMLMFIGASPGSTGGGIKTTSFALLLLMIWNRLKGQEQVNVFNRTIPSEILTRTIAIIFASAFSVTLITSILLFVGGTGNLPPLASRHLFVEYLFETVSAFGNVGLSLGITPNLSTGQKLAIILVMFAGRVGPLTLAFSWFSPKGGLTYAEESVMVG
ncbi:MAG TPA: TrkH family potassium uptake protein [Syntrophales bacterium]|nr:TrkH family potassium uptake protein [Syntrophales bacterium]